MEPGQFHYVSDPGIRKDGAEVVNQLDLWLFLLVLSLSGIAPSSPLRLERGTFVMRMK